MHRTPLMPAGFFRRFHKKLLNFLKKELWGAMPGSRSVGVTVPGSYLREDSLL